MDLCTATHCVYYYNYVLIADVDNSAGKVTKSHTFEDYIP